MNGLTEGFAPRRIEDVPRAKGQKAWMQTLAALFPGAPVVGIHTSKSVAMPIVNPAPGVYVGDNHYFALVCAPRAVLRLLPETAHRSPQVRRRLARVWGRPGMRVPREVRCVYDVVTPLADGVVWDPSFGWAADKGEVLIRCNRESLGALAHILKAVLQ